MSKFAKLFFTFAGGVIALACSSSASAQTCSNQSLKGSFGYTVTGNIVKNVGPLVAGPFVAVGKITFDGVGVCRLPVPWLRREMSCNTIPARALTA